LSSRDNKLTLLTNVSLTRSIVCLATKIFPKHRDRRDNNFGVIQKKRERGYHRGALAKTASLCLGPGEIAFRAGPRCVRRAQPADVIIVGNRVLWGRLEVARLDGLITDRDLSAAFDRAAR
jgi:hypothetical protein